jgi:diguanylate cyclase (GGDEF)-like protein
LKNWSYWVVVVSFIPSFIILMAEAPGFAVTLFTPMLILPPVVFLVTLRILFQWGLNRPTRNFLSTIHRAVLGDYRARYSCTKATCHFYQLSQAFNQFMDIVEKQTDELEKSRYLQNQLYENETIYRSALELTCERVFEADLTDNKLIYGQEIYRRTFSFLNTEQYDDMIKSISEQAIYDGDRTKYYNTFSIAHLREVFITADTMAVDLEYRQKLGSDEFQWMAATVIQTGNNANSLKVIGYVKNIDQRKRHELEILNQSQKDGLTALYNKRATQSLIESYLSREGNQNRGAVIMLDIDNFKSINDTLGHIQGDSALSQLGEKLQGLFRPVDVVGRIGGDEFLIYINDYSSMNTLTHKLDMLRAIFEDIHVGDDGSFQISGSIGVSLFPEDGKTYIELYQKADIALYIAKSRGKNCYYICGDRFGDQPAMHLNNSTRMNLCQTTSK